MALEAMVDLGFTSVHFPAGTHICQIFNDDDERNDALLRYLASGLKAGECTACFSESIAEPEIDVFLHDMGLSLADAKSRGAFTLAKTTEVYFQGGEFDPARMLGLLTDYHTQSVAKGFPNARVIGEMTAEIDQVPGGSRLLEYESNVSLLLRDHPITTVCQYDTRAFSGATIMDVLKVHPMMVVRGSVVRNPFYVPPERILELMPAEHPQLCAETLSRIMLLQSMLGQLPDESRICSFVCRGLADLPGVRQVRYEAGPVTTAESEIERVLTVEISRRCCGAFIATLASPSFFALYEAHVRNLCFMVAVVLEERRQRAANVAYQKELEFSVEERTHRLAAEKENLAVTLRSIGDAVITTDIHGNVVLMNAVAERLTGFTQTESAGKPLSACFHIVHKLTGALCDNPVERVLASNQVVELEDHTFLVTKDGRECAIADSGAPIRAGNGSVLGVVLVFRDMTEKHRMMGIAQRSDRLESLGVLAGGIAHDFNNLLGGIYGYLELAQLEVSNPEALQNLAAATVTIDRARGLTRQLLTFAKGGAPVKHGGTLLPVIKENVRFALSGTNVSSQLDLPDDLWTCTFDSAQFSQVIDNLVINAVQAMPTGGRIVVVARNVSLADGEIPTLPAGLFVRIDIQDTGTGIPREYLQRIFDPFFTTKKTGNGLGLATAYSIVKRHDGTILVESQPGRGTTFTLFLPASPTLELTPAPCEMPSQRVRGSILLMDDERALRDVTTKFLSSIGYKVLPACDGQEAIDLFVHVTQSDHDIVAVILDLTVPGGLGGKEAASAIRQRNSSVPIFVISGYSQDPIMAAPRDHGFTDSLCKPFTRGDLSALLAKHCSST